MLIFSIFCSALLLALNPTIVGAGAAVMAVILVWLGQREVQTLNPYFLFLSTPISLLLYSESVSPSFLPKMNAQVQILIILGIFSYLLGLLTVRKIGWNSPTKELKKYSFNAFLILGLAPHLIGIARTGIPLLADDVNLARSQYLAPIIGQLTLFLPLTAMAAFKDKSRKRVLISIAANTIASIFMVSKFSLFMFMMFAVFGFIRYQGGKLFPIPKALSVLIMLMVTPIVFNATFSARDNMAQTDYFWRNDTHFGVPLIDEYADFLYLPYMYTATPWSNFTYIYETSKHFEYGARSTHSFTSFLQLDSLIEIEPREIRKLPFNTHAYMSDFYLDFGLIGVILFSYLLGLLVKWAYVRAIRSGDLLHEAIWISVGFASFMLFFSNHFTNLTYPLISLLGFSSYRLLSGLAGRTR